MNMQKIKSLKGKKKIVALTAYDYPTSKILNESKVDIILVGDSLGMVVLGFGNTHFVTLSDIIRHTQAVMRGNSKALVVADMPINSCDTIKDAIKNCKKVIEETGVHAVKIEGKPEIVKAVFDAGISVMGHTGLKPQEVDKCKLQGKEKESAEMIIKESKMLEKAGVFSLILECIPEKLGKEITKILKIPTIGIGAGRYTDGQILVLHDIIGLSPDIKPRFVRRYAEVGSVIGKAVSSFRKDVEKGEYPSEKEVY